MEKKVVVKVPIKKAKDRNKAMKIAAGNPGVTSVNICGADKDMVVVIGDELNAYALVQSLMKKFGNCTTLVSMEAVNRGGSQNQSNEITENINQGSMIVCQPSYCNNIPPPPGYYMREPVYDPNPPCSIM